MSLTRLASVSILVIPLATLAPIAQADAIATSQSSLTVSMIVFELPSGDPIPAPPGLVITPSASVDLQLVVDQSGASTLSFDGSADTSGAGSSTRLDLTTDVVATASFAGKAHGTERVSGQIEIANNTAQDFSIGFTASYDYSNASLAGVPAVESAQTFFDLDVVTAGPNPCVLSTLVDENQATAAPPDELPGPVSGSDSVSVLISAGQTCSLLASIQSIAFADAVGIFADGFEEPI